MKGHSLYRKRLFVYYGRRMKLFEIGKTARIKILIWHMVGEMVKKRARFCLSFNYPALHMLQWVKWKNLQNRNQKCDCNWTLTQNHLVRKRTLNHLAKVNKWLSSVLSTYLYVAFDSISLSCHVHVFPYHVTWIHSETRTWHDKEIQSNAPYW